jgi:hypothetical protein
VRRADGGRSGARAPIVAMIAVCCNQLGSVIARLYADLADELVVLGGFIAGCRELGEPFETRWTRHLLFGKKKR